MPSDNFKFEAAFTQHVRPAGGRYEWLAVLAITLGILVLYGGYISTFGRDDKPQQIYDWQVSSFNTLEGADQAIYNALFTVKDDIPYIYDDVNRFNEPGVKFRWPNLDDFQEYFLPPFLHDTSWEQNGAMEWSLFEPAAEGEMQGYSMYLGTNGQVPQQGSFLLTIGHVHAGMENNNAISIWWHSDTLVAMPESGFQDTLIRDGWKYVVPYSGLEEINRLYGD